MMPRLKWWLLGLGAFALLAFLFLHSRMGQMAEHTQMVDDLRQMKEADGLLTQETLELRYSLLTNYDPLVATSQSLTESTGRLPGEAQALYPAGSRGILDSPLQAYLETLSQKQQLIEDFKSKNAILKNSLAYLPTLAAGLGNPETDKLLRQVLIYSTTNSKDAKESVQSLIEELSKTRARFPVDKQPDLDLLLSHARLILVQHEAVDNLLVQLVTLPTGQRNEDVFQADQVLYRDRSQQANNYSLALGIFCALLLVSVVGFLIQIGKSAQAVRQANETLESRVEERTQALEQSKAAMDAIVTHLRRLMAEVTAGADTVTATSGQLSTSAIHTHDVAGEIAEAIRDVNQSVSQSLQATNAMTASTLRQRQAVAQAGDGIQQAREAVQEVTHSNQQMAHSAQQASDIAQTCADAVAQTLASMARIQKQAEHSSATVLELERQSQEIGSIVKTIDAIAAQTNLLALNAAIEAARAGEHGRGFAVVAGEVRKLAERSTAATREISQLVLSINTEVSASIQAIDATTTEAASGATQSQEASSALSQIQTAAQTVVREVEAAGVRAQTMISAVTQVLGTVDTIRRATEENEQITQTLGDAAEAVSTRAHNVTTMIGTQTDSIHDIRDAATQLNTMALYLNDLVRQFPLEDEAEKVSEKALEVMPLTASLRRAA